MASRTAQMAELIARVRRLEEWGWKVGKSGTNYIVHTPTGRRLVMHMTPSDRNFLEVNLRMLDDFGFTEHENEWIEKTGRERAAKLKADREKADKDAAEAAKRAASVNRAAGAYGRKQPTILDILSAHPAPITWEQVLVTPEMATAMLSRNEPPHQFRKLNARHVARFEAILRNGRWHYTHQGVAFDVHGQLQDGQHRLTAIAQSGIAALMNICAGMPLENRDVVDTGRRRTGAQVLAARGMRYASNVTSVARLVYLFDEWGPDMLDHTSDDVENDVIAETAEKFDEDEIGHAVRDAFRLRAETKTPVSGSGAAFYILARQLGVQRELMTPFVEALIGVETDAPSSNPARVLARSLNRRRDANEKLPGFAVMGLILRAWNDWCSGVNYTTGTSSVRLGSKMPSPVTPKEAK